MISRKFAMIIVAVVVVVIVFLSFYYLSQVKIQSLTEKEKKEIYPIAKKIVDEMLQAFNEGNYTKFSENFNLQMKNSLGKEKFVEVRNKIISDVGLYVSTKNMQLFKRDNYIGVLYDTEFEKKPVKVEVYFEKTDMLTFQIAGLWFKY